ncbi:MAG: cytoskeletal protein binding protein [Geoglossum simile]|nr:MAG: cytoskeletal protein binding protein [Geoglossum simile]
MGFLGIYTALYAYDPQSDQELAIKEGDLLYITEKSSEDDWWKAKKRAEGDEDEEPVGLIPSNYIEEATPLHHVKALYDYTRQTDEEVSFSEGANLSVYDTSDPDWTLVGLNGEYGFAPANYIDATDPTVQTISQRVTPVRVRDSITEPDEPPTPSSPNSQTQSPAAAIAGIIQRKSSTSASNTDAKGSPPSLATNSSPRRPTYTPDASDDEGPPRPTPGLPARPKSGRLSPSPTGNTQPTSFRPPDSPGILESPPYVRATHPDLHLGTSSSLPGGFHLYNINEMVEVMGRQKKIPTTLGINTATGKILITAAKQHAPQQDWTVDKLNHYSIEGKHVFMELVRPSRSLDFHAGAKDTAREIVSALGEVAGAFRAEGLREVLEAGVGGKSQKTGKILYDFVAQGDDEVTVVVGDDVIILDSMKSEEWWQVRRVKNGMEGVVPSSYVELTGVTSVPGPSASGKATDRAINEKNVLEEEGLGSGAMDSSRKKGGGESKSPEVGPGVKLPQRGSSLLGRDGSNSTKQRSRRESRTDGKSLAASKQKPDAMRTRTWTDRSGSFKVEAEFLGCRDGKIHLHKLNGVKIAVPVVKMSVDDLEYVERVTGMSLDEDKPLSDIRRQRSQFPGTHNEVRAAPTTVGVTIDPSKKEEYDWFDFFLKCGVDVNLCQRYATLFSKDSMDETVLPDITPSVLRALGLKEGDILRVMKYLDNKYGRTGVKAKRNVSFGGAEVMGNNEGDSSDRGAPSSGGLFSGPGGALRNNTRKGRPIPTVQASDKVDPKAFGQKGGGDTAKTAIEPEAAAPPPEPTPLSQQKDSSGFDDDAWDVKPSKKQQPSPQPQQNINSPSPVPTATQTPAIQQPTLTGSLKELSLLTPTLQPTIAHRSAQQQTQQSSQTPPSQPVQQQSSGVTPPLFTHPGQTQSGGQFQQNSVPQASPQSSFTSSQTAFSQTGVQFQQSTVPPSLPTLISHQPSLPPRQQQQQQSLPPRQRPQAPHITQSPASLVLPPPPRPLSAPQNFPQSSGFSLPPLQQQLTGYQNQPNNFALQVTSPSQNLNDPIFQPQYGGQQMQPLGTGFTQQESNLNPQTTSLYTTGTLPHPAGFVQPFQQLPHQQTGIQSPQVFVNGQTARTLFGTINPQQQTSGFQSALPQSPGPQPPFPPISQQQQTRSINTFLPPALQPQHTGPASNFGPHSGQGQLRQDPQPALPLPKQSTLAPLQAQKTGPAPSVRFGVSGDMKRLTPQTTGRRANLSQASKSSVFPG